MDKDIQEHKEHRKPTRKARLSAWVYRHKKPLIITSAIILALGIATAVFFIFIFPTLGSDQQTNETSETPPPEPEKYYSKLSGLELAGQNLINSPVTCIMIENSPDARPHSGLGEASIVYEAIAEASITRFLTVWQNFETPLIGPVRSLRLYYLEWATPFDCSIAHVGGSEEALKVVRNTANGYRDIDQFFNDANYWRSTDRYAPHNVYTNSALMNDLNAKKDYTSSDFTAPLRAKESTPVDTPTATKINLKISTENYNPVYTYDPATNTYLRSYQTGTPHMATTSCTDRSPHPQVKDCEQKQLAPSVVIAMEVKESGSIVEPGRESITTTGSGQAVIFQNGEVIEAIWSRASTKDQLKFSTPEGTEIPLNPGQLWISAIPSHSGTITWE